MSKRWHTHALLISLFFLIQVALAHAREQPLRMSDEAVFLANALYLSGSAPMPTLHGAHYSAFGYSLFLVPAFWVFDHPHAIYFASLVISALLMSTLYLGLCYVLTSYTRFAVALLCSRRNLYLSLSSYSATCQLRLG